MIKFAGFMNDGTVIVYINGKRYVYITDAVYHDKWKQMVKHAPFRVLNLIKDQVKKGLAFEEHI